MRFRIENAATQGALAVPQIVDALGALDRDPQVEVIVLARGGGSIEDLLPFSDETLCRAVAECRTPVVSAIGHEPDTPLVDHVADLRCSTPTEAGRRLVPDLAEETARIAGLRDRARRALAGWVDREQRLLVSLRERPVLADPLHALDQHGGRDRPVARAARGSLLRGLDRRGTDLGHVRHRLAALGPAATLARGYAIVQRVTGGRSAAGRTAAGAALGGRGDRRGPAADPGRRRRAGRLGARRRAGAGSCRRRTGRRGRGGRGTRTEGEHAMTERPAIEQLGYEQARDELAEVVRALEAGGLSLDESVALWERGEALARHCEEQLAGARERVQRVLDPPD